MKCTLECVFCLLFLVLVVKGSIPTNSLVSDASNCLAARWNLVFALTPANIQLKTDPFVYSKNHMEVWNTSLCTNDPYAVYLDDEACQCDAAKQFYIIDNPTATMDTAFQLYLDQITLAVANHWDNATTWHCEACPKTVKAITNYYTHMEASCSCIGAREQYINSYGDLAPNDFDPVGYFNLYGFIGGRPWPDCATYCGTNPVYIENQGYRYCQQAQDAYRADTLAWWAPYFNDTWLAYWNSFVGSLRPMYHYEYCSPIAVVAPTSNSYLIDPSNCLEARWDMVFQLSGGSGIPVTDDIYVWTHQHGFGPNVTMCTSDSDPVYMFDQRCQCDAAKYLYIQENPHATPDTAFQLYSDGVTAAMAAGTPAPTWHCEACPNAVKKRTPLLKHIALECTCIAAINQYYTNNPDAFVADWDAIGFEEKYPTARPWVDCSLCASNPVYMDNPGYVSCTSALAEFASDANAWWAGTWHDTFLAYWNAFWIVGQPRYHFEECSPVNLTAVTTTSTTSASTSTTGSAAPTASSSATGSTSSTGSSTGSSGSGSLYISDPSNCLAARWDLVWSRMRFGDVVKTDPYVWAYKNLAYMNTSLCTADPDPIYMDDPRCQCDEAKQFYIQDNPSATMDTAFDLYMAGISNAIAAHSAAALSWRCEACPDTMKKRTPAYQYISEYCTCTAARDAYLVLHNDVKAADYDAVGFLERYGAANGYLWVDCSICNYNPVYLDNPGYANCPAANAAYVADSVAWWGQYFYDPFMAVYNSYWLAGQPRFKYELCTPQGPFTTGPGTGTSTNNSVVVDTGNCLAARLNVVWALAAQQIKLTVDPKIWALANGGGGWQNSLCTSDPDPVYMWQDRCQCDLAKQFYVSQDASATVDTAFQTWARRVGTYDINVPSWHCEACPGTVKKQKWALTHVTPNCTCLAAREKYLTINYDANAADFDPVYFQDKLGWNANPPRVWDCTPCNATGSNPVYIDDSISANCTDAHAAYISEASWAAYFADPFLAYWNSVPQIGQPQYHYEYCTKPGSSLPLVGVPKHLSWNCTCMAARLKYWGDHIDVWGSAMDPVAHYDAYGWSSGAAWTWHCELCNPANNPVYISDTASRCQAAAQRFSSDYKSEPFVDPWTYYINNYLVQPKHMWHAEMCDGVVHAIQDTDQVALPETCTCLAARLDYWKRFPVTKIQDPVWYYNKAGKGNGWTWGDCDLCSDDSVYEVVYINDPVCQTCDSARTKYLNSTNYLGTTVGAEFYEDTWLHYWNNYMSLGLPWHCEDCVNLTVSPPTTGGGGSTTGSTASPSEPLPAECRCLQAANQYLNDHMDVRAAGNDPIKYYLSIGFYSEGSNNWKCSLCDYNPIYMEDQCNCTAAQMDFINRYQYSSLDPSAAFEYYNSSSDLTLTWDCTKCSLNISNVPQDKQCIAARTDYLARYPEVLKASPYYMDAVYFHEYIGFSKGYTWDTTLCGSNNSPFYYEDSVCNCKEANARYIADYRTGGYSDYIANKDRYGMSWRCDLCSNNQLDPSSSLACNCTSARGMYSTTYFPSTDPWTHYTSTGKALGNVWDCAACNDTCHAAPASISAWAYPKQKFNTGANVFVPSGCHVPFQSQTLNIFSLTVNGSLRCEDISVYNTIGIAGQRVTVNGLFQCGTEASPFAGSLTLTLAGVNSGTGMDVEVANASTNALIGDTVSGGNKGVVVAPGGVLTFHGSKTVSWTRLALSTSVADSQIEVLDAVDWSVGDQIVITTTDLYGPSIFDNNEVRTISAISGTIVTLGAGLSYAHAAETHNLTFNTQTSLLTLQKRAEVALLSRNIIITSDSSTQLSDSYGTHVTAQAGSYVYVSGVQITVGGQESNGTIHYPFEWDSAGVVTGQYHTLSIVRSSNGCVGVKNTVGATVSDNVCYNFTGHGFALTAGSESGNLIDSNIAIASNIPANYGALPDKIAVSGYGAFLITNPNNTLSNNVAVSSGGPGYWVQWNPATATATWDTFVNNLAHSVYVGYTSCPSAQTSKNSWNVRQLTVYGTAVGIYPCGTTQTFQDSIVAESQVGFQADSLHYVKNSAFVTRFGAAQTLDSSVAVRLTTSGWSMDRILFLNYDLDSQYSIFVPSGSDTFNPATQISNVARQNSPVVFADPTNSTFFQGYYGQFSTNVYDTDGTLTGYPGYTLVTSHPLMIDSTCVKLSSSFGYACPFGYKEMRITYAALGLPVAAIGRFSYGTSSKRMQTRATTSDTTPAVYFPPPTDQFYRWSAIMNSNYVYTFLMPITKHAISNITMPNSYKGDTVALQFSNVLLASGFSGAAQVDSCDTVYSSHQQSYHYDSASGTLCVRLIANTLISNANSPQNYTSTILVTATADKNTVGQPAAPYTDGPNAVPQKCTCLAAMQDYWTRYPSIYKANIDPLYHYQQIIGQNNPDYTWSCECDDQPHYIAENFCNCTAARDNYTAAYPDINMDPYEHYLLYELTLGYGYHCYEYCTPPVDYDVDTITYSKLNTALSAALGAIIGLAVLLNLFGFVVLVMGFADYAKHGKFYSGMVLIGAFLAFVSAFVTLPTQTDSLCLAFPWFLGVGFSLVYGCLFIKTWTLYKVWRNAEKYKKSNLTPMYILKGIALCVAVEVVSIV